MLKKKRLCLLGLIRVNSAKIGTVWLIRLIRANSAQNEVFLLIGLIRLNSAQIAADMFIRVNSAQI